jgi:hypothetical protein
MHNQGVSRWSSTGQSHSLEDRRELMPEKKPEPFKTFLAKAGTVDERLGNQLYEPKVNLYFAQQKELKDGNAKVEK